MPNAGLDCKPMPLLWKEGTRLGFELLTRPTVRRARGSKNAGAEVDAFQWGSGALKSTRNHAAQQGGSLYRLAVAAISTARRRRN